MTKKKFTQGNRYKVLLKDDSNQEGVFVFEKEEFIYLKLNSGYNIGIAKDKIILSEQLKPKRKEVAHVSEEKSEEKSINTIASPEIIILHTGGTIASKVDYSTGAVNAKFTPSEMLELFPELKNIARFDSVLISNMPSDDINFAHYNKMAKAIEDALNINTLKGIILTQGTDTLHYTASALSFIFEFLPIPIVIVGAQRSSDRPSSDASSNLISAAKFIMNAEKNNINGVFICMHESNNDDYCTILCAQNVKKMHSSRRDAFKAINSSPFARVHFDKEEIEILRPNATVDLVKKEKIIRLFKPEIKVGIIRSRPGLLSDEMKFYGKFDGMILEGTGLGHFPIDQFDNDTKDNKKILKEIEKLASTKIACMTTQTISGRVNLNVYSPGRTLKDMGVLGHNLDMTTETAYIKLAWLLSNYSLDDAKKLYSQNLRGEITERSEKEEFL